MLIIASKYIGIFLVLAGIIITLYPSLLVEVDSSLSNYKAIEKRVMWGILIGVGLCFIFLTPFSPWWHAAAALVFWLALGILASRIIAMVAIDISILKQWMWVGVEVIIALIIGYYLHKTQIYNWL